MIWRLPIVTTAILMESSQYSKFVETLSLIDIRSLSKLQLYIKKFPLYKKKSPLHTKKSMQPSTMNISKRESLIVEYRTRDLASRNALSVRQIFEQFEFEMKLSMGYTAIKRTRKELSIDYMNGHVVQRDRIIQAVNGSGK